MASSSQLERLFGAAGLRCLTLLLLGGILIVVPLGRLAAAGSWLAGAPHSVGVALCEPLPCGACWRLEGEVVGVTSQRLVGVPSPLVG